MPSSVSENAIYCSYPMRSSEKQGIVTILCSEQVNSLRRTLSADMSSKKWLAQHGRSPAMKKIASSDEISVSVPNSSSSSQGGGDSDAFGFIREENSRKETEKKHLPIDMWSSILSDRAGEEASKYLPPPPYVHPLVKRSASSLSENSLQICTESLGSETGSDGFSSYPSSEIGDDGKDEEESEDEKENYSQRVKMEEVIRPVKFNKTKSPSRSSFPPPLPWLSDSSGASVRVQSRREKGRLTLEAVLFPSRSNFLARREDGRLLLSFADCEELDADLGEEREEEIKEQLVSLEDQEKENEKYSETVEEDEEEAEEDENDLRRKTTQMEIMMKNGVINVHRLALMVKRPSGLANYKFNEEIKSEAEEEGGAKSPLKPRLSPPPLTTSIEAPSSLNAYESYWRSKALALTKPIRQENPSSAMNNNSSTKRIFSKNLTENEQKTQITGFRGNRRDDNSVSLSKLCKEPRKSLLFWEPYCIATS